MAQLIICLRSRRPGFHPWVRKIPWKREWLPTLVFLPGEFDGQRFLEGHSAWGHKESDMSERLTFTPPGRDDESTGGCVCVCVCVCVCEGAGRSMHGVRGKSLYFLPSTSHFLIHILLSHLQCKTTTFLFLLPSFEGHVR